MRPETAPTTELPRVYGEKRQHARALFLARAMRIAKGMPPSEGLGQ